jgi:hypothetical protein
VERELQYFGKRVDYYKQNSRDHEGQKLLNSGIADALVWYAFGYETCRHLLKWYPKTVEIDWDNVDEDADFNTTDLLQLLVAWQENDAIDNDWTLETREWFRIARGRKTRSSLETFCKLFAASALPHIARECDQRNGCHPRISSIRENRCEGAHQTFALNSPNHRHRYVRCH